MIEVFAAFALGAASSGAAFFFAARQAKSERSALLDRLMARDLGELKAYETRPQAAVKPTDAERRQQEDDLRVAGLAGGLV